MSDTPTTEPSVLQDRFSVVVRKQTYTFRMPSIRFEMEVGYRTNDICGRSMPEGSGANATLMGPGSRAYNFAWCCAVMELYLVSSTTEWPWTDGPGKVNSEKFPLNRSRTVEDIGTAFGREVDRFRDDGTADEPPPGTEAVAGQQNPG